MTSTATQTQTCPRCNGRGEFDAYQHVWGGKCFQCEGKGTVEVRTKSAAAVARAQAKRAAEDARCAERRRRIDEIEARIMEIMADDPQVLAARARGANEMYIPGLAVDIFRKQRGLREDTIDLGKYLPA